MELVSPTISLQRSSKRIKKLKNELHLTLTKRKAKEIQIKAENMKFSQTTSQEKINKTASFFNNIVFFPPQLRKLLKEKHKLSIEEIDHVSNSLTESSEKPLTKELQDMRLLMKNQDDRLEELCSEGLIDINRGPLKQYLKFYFLKKNSQMDFDQIMKPPTNPSQNTTSHCKSIKKPAFQELFKNKTASCFNGSFSGSNYNSPNFSGNGPNYNGPNYNGQNYNGPNYNGPNYNITPFNSAVNNASISGSLNNNVINGNGMFNDNLQGSLNIPFNEEPLTLFRRDLKVKTNVFPRSLGSLVSMTETGEGGSKEDSFDGSYYSFKENAKFYIYNNETPSTTPNTSKKSSPLFTEKKNLLLSSKIEDILNDRDEIFCQRFDDESLSIENYIDEKQLNLDYFLKNQEIERPDGGDEEMSSFKKINESILLLENDNNSLFY